MESRITVEDNRIKVNGQFATSLDLQRLPYQLQKKDFRNVNFDGFDLRNTNFYGSNMVNASFERTILFTPEPEEPGIGKKVLVSILTPLVGEDSGIGSLMSHQEDAGLTNATVDPDTLLKLSCKQVNSTYVEVINPYFESCMAKLIAIYPFFLGFENSNKDIVKIIAILSAQICIEESGINFRDNSAVMKITSSSFIKKELESAFRIAKSNFWSDKNPKSWFFNKDNNKPGGIREICSLENEQTSNFTRYKKLKEIAGRENSDRLPITHLFYDNIRKNKVQVFEINYASNLKPVVKK